MESEVKKIMADVLGVQESTLNPSSSSKDLERWDSMHHLYLVFALEEHFGVEFYDTEIGEMTSLGSILDMLDRKNGSTKGSP